MLCFLIYESLSIMLLIRFQVQAVLPLTTLAFPLLWRFLDMYGIARVLSLYEKAKKVNNKSLVCVCLCMCVCVCVMSQ